MNRSVHAQLAMLSGLTAIIGLGISPTYDREFPGPRYLSLRSRTGFGTKACQRFDVDTARAEKKRQRKAKKNGRRK